MSCWTLVNNFCKIFLLYFYNILKLHCLPTSLYCIAFQQPSQPLLANFVQVIYASVLNSVSIVYMSLCQDRYGNVSKIQHYVFFHIILFQTLSCTKYQIEFTTNNTPAIFPAEPNPPVTAYETKNVRMVVVILHVTVLAKVLGVNSIIMFLYQLFLFAQIPNFFHYIHYNHYICLILELSNYELCRIKILV